jgi:hypothetical protein
VVDLRRNRDLIREPRSLARLTTARGWLRRFGKLKSVNKSGTSYGLKHMAEDDIGYVTNGVFIAVAIAEGFTVRRADFDSANAWFNISTEAWRHATDPRRYGRRKICSVSGPRPAARPCLLATASL